MPDKWGGEDLDFLEQYRRDEDGDRIIRVVTPSGDSLVIFAYRDHAPQVIAYPGSIQAMRAFREMSMGMGGPDTFTVDPEMSVTVKPWVYGQPQEG